jgi:hypothetical protein
MHAPNLADEAGELTGPSITSGALRKLAGGRWYTYRLRRLADVLPRNLAPNLS